MAENQKYNGWTNYETWSVAIWIDNEQGSYSYWYEQAREAWEAADPKKLAKVDPSFSRVERAAMTLADQLKTEVMDGAPELQPSLYSDILMAGLQETNWYEIAHHWVEEISYQ